MLMAHEFFDALPINVFEVRPLPLRVGELGAKVWFRRNDLKDGVKPWSHSLHQIPLSVESAFYHKPSVAAENHL